MASLLDGPIGNKAEGNASKPEIVGSLNIEWDDEVREENTSFPITFRQYQRSVDLSNVLSVRTLFGG